MTTAYKLDRIDIRILAELQNNGRMTNVNLADKVGLSPSPCLKRVKQLEDARYITGYGAYIDLAKLGDYVTVFTEFTLSQHHPQSFREFEKALEDCPEVLECHLISGGYDYLVKFITRSINHYQEVINGLLSNDKMVREYFSYIVIKTPIKRNTLGLEAMFRPST